jgi:hypothetical protein
MGSDYVNLLSFKGPRNVRNAPKSIQNRHQSKYDEMFGYPAEPVGDESWEFLSGVPENDIIDCILTHGYTILKMKMLEVCRNGTMIILTKYIFIKA